MWFPVEEPWQYRVLDRLPSGVDVAQLERTRKLSPTERIAAVEELMQLATELQQAVAAKRPGP